MLEGLIASVVLALAVIGIASVIGAAHQQTAAMRHSAEAVALAELLMEEIAARPFDPPQGESADGSSQGVTDRDAYHHIGAYDGYTDSADAMTLPGGGTFGSTADGGFTRSVAVEYRKAPDGPARTEGDFALVTVRVEMPDGGTIQLSQLAARY